MKMIFLKLFLIFQFKDPYLAENLTNLEEIFQFYFRGCVIKKIPGKPRKNPGKPWVKPGKTLGKPQENPRKTKGKPQANPGKTPGENPGKAWGNPRKTL